MVSSRRSSSSSVEALRQARLHVLRREEDSLRPYQHPGYWAPFGFIGDFR